MLQQINNLCECVARGGLKNIHIDVIMSHKLTTTLHTIAT